MPIVTGERTVSIDKFVDSIIEEEPIILDVDSDNIFISEPPIIKSQILMEETVGIEPIIDTGVRFEYEPPLVLESEPIDEFIVKSVYITVDGVEYDITGLTNMQRLVMEALKITYEGFSVATKEAMSFDVYVYNMTKAEIFARFFERESELLETIYDVADIEPESWLFKLKVWYSELLIQIKLFKDRSVFLMPFIIILGVIIIALIGYQFVKSYVSAKAQKRAMK